MQTQSAIIANNTNLAPMNLKDVMQRYGVMHKLDRGKNLSPGIYNGNYIYLIVSGAVKFSHELPGGDEVLIDLFLNGDIIVVRPFDNPDRENTATTLETTYIRVLPIYKFNEISQDNPKLQNQLLLVLGRHINSLQKRLIFLRRSATERVADFLLEFLNSNRILPNGCIYLPLSRYEIGCYLSLTAETVCRVLCQLEQNEIIQKHGRSIEVLDYDALVEKSGCSKEELSQKLAKNNIATMSFLG